MPYELLKMGNFIAYFNIIALLLCTALVCAAFYKELAFFPEEASLERKERGYAMPLLIILAAALLLRLWGFGLIPGGINQDGAMAAVDGKALADYGTDRFGTRLPAHLYAWGFGQMSSLLSYLIAGFVKLFGLSTVTARLPQLLASLMGGVCFYVFVREGFGKRAGLIAAALLAINPWHMMQSRWALDCNLLPHFFMAGLCCLQHGLKARRGWIYVSMIFFGLCMYCYGIAIYTVSAFLLVLGLVLLFRKQLKLTELLACALVWLLVSWPFIFTMAINYFGWETVSLPFVTMQYFKYSVRSGDILFFSSDFMGQLLLNLKSLVNVVLLQKKDLPWNDMSGYGTMYIFSTPFMFLGLFAMMKSRGTGRALGLAGLLSGVWAGLVTNSVNINRVNIIFYFVLLLIALGFELGIKHFRPAALPVAALYFAAAIMMCSAYFTDYAESVEKYFYKGFGEALRLAEDSGADVIYVTADAQAEGYAHVSEILTLFYDETDALYYQGKSSVNKGEELLPYAERFRYVSVTGDVVARAREDSAFVALASDAPCFPRSEYKIIYCGGYICALPLG